MMLVKRLICCTSEYNNPRMNNYVITPFSVTYCSPHVVLYLSDDVEDPKSILVCIRNENDGHRNIIFKLFKGIYAGVYCQNDGIFMSDKCPNKIYDIVSM